MLKYWVVCAAVIVGCGKKNENATATGSASATEAAGGSAAAATGSAGSAIAAPAAQATPPADLPPSSAPGTAEVLAKFDAACDGGYGKACFDAGMRRAKGMGSDADRVAAVAWLEKGCKLDDADSCSLLAGFYALGQEGVTQNKARAVELHQKACPRVPTSCRLLAQYYGRGEVVQADIAKAMSLLDQACSAGDQPACKQAAEHRAAGTDR